MEVQKYDDIRPFRDEELPEVIDRLLQDPQFCAFIPLVAPDVTIDAMKAQLRQLKGVLDFQQKVMHPIVRSVARKTTDSLDLSGFKNLDKSHPYTYVSNHRDIILDSAFLDILLIEKGLDTFGIAIGDNLLIYPWISDLVRINKSFLVKRGLPVRQQLEASLELSSYMHDTIEEKNQSIWIAQREGRAKDSNDRTQVSILKMLNLGGSGSVLENIASMNIVPVSISYEYDPCDFLKAKEMQQKRDDPDYKKSQKDDIQNMKTGLMGYKGRVFYKVSPCISEELLKMEGGMHKNELYEKVANLMDSRIHINYHLYPGNYIAADMLDGIDRFSQSYSASEKEHFATYIKQQLEKIDLKNKDEHFLQKSMLEMYSNPLRNKLEAEKSR
ncbi:MAG: 1-acyl-sn-glycerol-3-phosphate acyltransferase [Bacteroidales bacterium]|nr:1-acyl-sn-glycerol-3-phosphate acyltransferase [Bacteroidales bacterium]